MKRLYRSRKDKVFSGVCGGLGEYFGVDAALFRIIWFLAAFTIAPIFGYIVAAVIIPNAPLEDQYSIYEEESISYEGTNRGNLLLGGLLVGVGILILIRRFILPLIPNLFNEIFWPLVLIIFGGLLILRKKE